MFFAREGARRYEPWHNFVSLQLVLELLWFRRLTRRQALLLLLGWLMFRLCFEVPLPLTGDYWSEIERDASGGKDYGASHCC